MDDAMTRFLLVPLLLLLASCATSRVASGPPPLSDEATAPDTTAVNEESFIPIGGIEQWVTINGASRANPVVLVLHGGPGNPMTPYADAVYGAWERDFTLVQWDQRGAGRTFGRNPGSAQSRLTMDRMAQDGNELAAYIARHLGKEKVILLGGSWGSALGIHMVRSRPELFHAYVGTGQLVSYRDNEAASYRQVLDLARAAEDTKTLATIEALGPPPWSNPRNFGILRRATRTYEAKTSTAAPSTWWIPAPEYATPAMQADYEGGEEYSYLEFVGLEGNGMLSMIDLPALGTHFDVPIFLVQGAQDLVTTADVARRYFDSIEAPQKAYVLLPDTGHDPNATMIDAQYELLKTRVVPLLD
jgi:pimeloyl-ACP methyl ester carboxylesterase